MSGITGLVVTHAGLAPPGYTRTAVVAAGGSESTATVWTTKLPGKDGSLEPLVQIDVIIGDPAAAPAGFSVADISVTREPAAPAFLAFRRRGTAEEKAPITDLALDTPDTPARELLPPRALPAEESAPECLLRNGGRMRGVSPGGCGRGSASVCMAAARKKQKMPRRWRRQQAPA